MHLTRTPLIGRAAEVQALERLILVDRARLLSITGPGGVGKTRLALHLASEIGHQFRDGANCVFLSAVSDQRLVPLAIARALNLRPSGEIPPEEELILALADRELLLVIDTFEHLLPASSLFSELITSCPDLRIIVTSRAELGLPHEEVYRVSPLGTPADHDRVLGAAATRAFDAVALFEARARAASSDFALTDENAGAVAEICRKLDGLPLAIELAAARIRAMPPNLMLRHLDDRRETPGGARDAQSRHRTMRDAIAWSYELLNPLEQQLFRVLSVFRGSFTATQAVDLYRNWDCSGGDLVPVQDRIEQLGRASLLLPVPSSAPEPSYQMLGLLREFGHARLDESGEDASIRRAHARWVAAQLSSGRSTQIAPLREEIRAAITWSIDRSEPSISLSLLESVEVHWMERGYYEELRGWLEQSLAHRRDGAPPSSLLIALARLCARQGDLARSIEYAETALELASATGDRAGTADAILAIAAAEGRAGNHERSRALASQAMTTLEIIGDRRRLAEAQAQLAQLAVIRKDLAATQSAAESALAYWRENGEPIRAISMLDLLSLVARLRGDRARQSALALQTLEFTRQCDDPFQIASGLWTAAAIACERGRFIESARFYGAEEAIRTATGFAIEPSFKDEKAESIAIVRNALGMRAFASNWEAGRSLLVSSALDEAVVFLADIARREADLDRSERFALQSVGLSERQQDVLRLIGQGRSDREIAEMLSISVRTVSKHVEAILTRLDVRTRSGAAATAVRLIAESSTVNTTTVSYTSASGTQK